MNRMLHIAIICLALNYNLKAQVLDVSLVTQEQNAWCWAAVSKCVLDYYGVSVEQCSIAEFTRGMAVSWHNFGSQNCCQTPVSACNYLNYDWGYPGSIQEILLYFASIQNYGTPNTLTVNEIASEINKKYPVIIRWAWTTGGGHFIVAHGFKDNLLYYMNPWPGEGFKIALYDWIVSGSDYKWENSLRMLKDPSPSTIIDVVNIDGNICLYPNPSRSGFQIQGLKGLANIIVYDSNGMTILAENAGINDYISMKSFPSGLYFISINTGAGIIVKKFIKE